MNPENIPYGAALGMVRDVSYDRVRLKKQYL